MVCAVHSQSQLISPTPHPHIYPSSTLLAPIWSDFFFPQKIGQGNNPLKKKKKQQKTENKAPKEKRLLHLEY